MKKNIAIIGVGPRGLCALEQLCLAFSQQSIQNLPFIHLFETSSSPGSGQVWNTCQPAINWLNISQRALHELKGRKEIEFHDFSIPPFPSYIEWLPEEKRNTKKTDADLFPERSQMGAYLNDRYSSILNSLLKVDACTLHNKRVDRIDYQQSKFMLYTTENNSYEADEVVLTIGHQPTEDSDQLKEWKTFERKNEGVLLFPAPYPAEAIMKSESIKSTTKVAIRGFGLAMIDDVRALTIGRGGHFEIVNEWTFESVFHSASSVPEKIAPFSLDGKPMVPKPLNAAIDQFFEPSEDEMNAFKNKISRYTEGKESTKTIDFLIDAMAAIAAAQYIQLKEKSVYYFEPIEAIAAVIKNWLKDETFKHPSIYPSENPVEKTIADFIDMSVNATRISLDYCLGQVWRHCQPCMYQLFSHAAISPELMSEVVKLDERMKRYAYGPPVESSQQLLALFKAGVLTFEWVNDPEIKLKQEGWQLINGSSQISCSVMINSILDAPQLLKVNSALIKDLLSDDLLQPVHSEFGIKTQTDGRIELSNKTDSIPLAVLGRLCQGSVLGVDAILECFRLRIDDWAEGVLKRNA